MGAYLSSPICDTDTVEDSNETLAYVASSMQGWRVSQEDAHNAILNYDNKTSLFAVYDGHGGAEIALYCSRHLPDFLKQLDSYRRGQFQDALTEGFLQFDSLLLEKNVKEILRVLADEKDKHGRHDDDGEATDEEQNNNSTHDVTVPKQSRDENNPSDELNAEEAHLLRREAEVPIEELVKRYSDKATDQGKHFHSPNISKRTARNPLVAEQGKKDRLHTSKDSRSSESNAEDALVSSTTTSTDANEIKADEMSDREVVQSTTDSKEVQPSSSEAKSTQRAPRKPASTVSTTSTTEKSASLTHQLLNSNMEDVEDEDEDDDVEFNGSDEDTSDDEAEDPETDEDSANPDDDEEDEEFEVEAEESNLKLSKLSKTAHMKKMMRKSIMTILNRRARQNKRDAGNEDDQGEEEGSDDEDEDDDDEEKDEDDEDDEENDDDNDADLGKMLDMSSDPGSSSGCTAVVAILREKQLFVANAGDSRCVVCRDGRAIEMSNDHKPEDPEERTRIEKAGYKVTLDGRVSGGLNLSRAIGDHAYKKTHTLPPEAQAISALPDVRTLTLEDQDEFMVIACDGIWNFMSSQDVVDFVRARLSKKSLREICDELFMHCLAPNTSGDGTGCDNMTTIIVKFNFNQPSTTNVNESSTTSKSTEHSPWATMFSPGSSKRSLSPDHQSSTDAAIDSPNSKKLKATVDQGMTHTLTSPTKTAETFSFISTINNNNNSNDDQQQ